MPKTDRTNLRIACQTFTWEMSGPIGEGDPDDILQAISSAGYAGIEITDRMIGGYADRPERFEAALASHGLTLVSLAYGSESGFTRREAVASDIERGRRWIDYASCFDGAVVSIGSATSVSDADIVEQFEVAAEIYNRTAEIGRAAGVAVAVHPSSHHRTLLFDRQDYDRIFRLLDPDLVGWVPDTGHIMRGHSDILDTLRTYRDRIRYLHLKDVDPAGQWAMLGEGVCDVEAVVDIVASSPRFNGWLVIEEESEEAGRYPAQAVARNHLTIRRQLGRGRN